jgi:hypothetical protein
MLRFALFLLFVFLLFGMLWRTLSAARRPLPGAGAPARMVQCAHCALYLPEEEALRRDAAFYCSEEHRLRGPRATT